jgi:hypothetical protein
MAYEWCEVTAQGPIGPSGNIASQSQASLSPALLQPSETTETEPQFNVSIGYAYIGPRTDGFTEPNPMQTNPANTTLFAKSLYPSLICLNVTDVSSSVASFCDAKIDSF